MAFTASPSEASLPRLNEMVTAGNCPWWLMVSGPVVVSKCAMALSGTWLALAARTAGFVPRAATGGCHRRRRALRSSGRHVDVLQRIGIGAELRIDFQHHVILVQLGEHDRHQPLAEGVVQRVVDGAGGDSQARSGVAIDDQSRLRRLVLLIGGDVAQLGQGLQLVHQLRGPVPQLFGIGIFQLN